MEHCRSFEQNVLLASREEMRGSISILDPSDFIACPRPRRVGLSSVSSLQPMSHATEPCDSKAGSELLDLILKKEYSAVKPHDTSEIASSPPFFSGSPPSRACNPLVQDARFKEEGSDPVATFPGASPLGLLPSLSSADKGCVSRQIGAKPPTSARVEGFAILGQESKNSRIPAAVRVEGFHVLNGDRPNSGIPAAMRVGGLDILGRDRQNSSVFAAA